MADISPDLCDDPFVIKGQGPEIASANPTDFLSRLLVKRLHPWLQKLRWPPMPVKLLSPRRASATFPEPRSTAWRATTYSMNQRLVGFTLLVEKQHPSMLVGLAPSFLFFFTVTDSKSYDVGALGLTIWISCKYAKPQKLQGFSNLAPMWNVKCWEGCCIICIILFNLLFLTGECAFVKHTVPVR